MQRNQSKAITQFSRLLLCLSLGLALGGCNLMQTSTPEPVKEPPLIPEPVAPTENTDSDSAAANQPKTLYEYMAELGDASRHNSLLREAVSKAIEVGVLKPTSPQERFEPQKPICFGEFRDWAIAYQQVSAPMPSVSMNSGISAESSGLIGGIADIPTSKLKIPPASMSWGGHSVTASHVLTRQELCALYIFLSNQDEAVRKMSNDDIEAANPAHDPMSPDEALSQFKDYASIGPWARRYVATAYQDGILQKIFNLLPLQLTGDEGFLPTKEISREEAILLLDSLYGQNAHIPSNTLIKASDSLTPKGNTVSSMHGSTEQMSGPVPVGKLESIRESGPHGSRSAIRVNGPE